MNQTPLSLKILFVSLVASVVAFLGFNFSHLNGFIQSKTLGTVNTISDRNFIDALGTAAAPITLASTNVTSTGLRIPGLSNLVLAGTYTPKATNSVVYITLDRSIDYGQTWYPYLTITPSTDRVSVWANGFVTSSAGVPFLIPGSSTSVTNTPIPFSFDLTLAGDYIRVLAKESTSGTAGTLNVQLLNTNH